MSRNVPSMVPPPSAISSLRSFPENCSSSAPMLCSNAASCSGLTPSCAASRSLTTLAASVPRSFASSIFSLSIASLTIVPAPFCCGPSGEAVPVTVMLSTRNPFVSSDPCRSRYTRLFMSNPRNRSAKCFLSSPSIYTATFS